MISFFGIFPMRDMLLIADFKKQTDPPDLILWKVKTTLVRNMCFAATKTSLRYCQMAFT